MGIVAPSTLVAFDTATPSTVSIRSIAGLGAGEVVVGIDKRPATGEVFIATVPSGVVASALVRTYSLNPASGLATFVGSIPNTVPGAGDYETGYDFNPAVDRIRVVVENNENFRINPTNGTLAGDDANLTYSGVVGPIVEVAYDRNVAPGPPGTIAPPGTQTTAYAISRGDNKLAVIGGLNGAGPGGVNGGQVTAVGALGVTLNGSAPAGLDISRATGIAYAALTDAAGAGLYTVDLATGAATLIGRFPTLAKVGGMTILDVPPDITKPAGLLGPAATATPRRLLRGTWKVRFSSTEAVTATSTLTGKVNGRKKTLGKGAAALAAAGVGSIGAPLTTAGRKLARSFQRTRGVQTRKAMLTVVLKDAAGNATTLRAPVTIRG